MDPLSKNSVLIVVDGLQYAVNKHVKEDIARLLKPYESRMVVIEPVEPEALLPHKVKGKFAELGKKFKDAKDELKVVNKALKKAAARVQALEDEKTAAEKAEKK